MKVAGCCLTLRCLTTGHRCWRSPSRLSAGSIGGRSRPPMRAARLSAPWHRRKPMSRAGPVSARRDLLTRGRRCCERPGTRMRSGAGATAVLTGTSASPRMPTPTPCPWKSATRAWTSLPIRAPTVITASARGVRISDPRSRTTRSSSAAGASPAEVGPFMWVRHAHARELEVIDDGDIARWTAEHDGYASLDPPALHRRSVLLDRASRSIDIIDEIEGGRHDVRLAFHLGPEIQAQLNGVLRGPELAYGIRARSGAAGTVTQARVEPASR